MKMIISNSAPTPIYQQIKDQIVEQILSGELKTNELLPSIRSLAQDIRISVMTIKKAYDELEKEGYIQTIQGKGSFVAPKNMGLAKEKAQQEIEDHLQKIIELADQYAISKEEIREVFELFLGEKYD